MSETSVCEAMSRRRPLGSGGAAALGGMVLREAVSGPAHPATNLDDRGAKIRISGLRGFRVGTKAYVKIETNHKITGWGEVDESMFAKVNADPRRQYKWPSPKSPDGAVRDY